MDKTKKRTRWSDRAILNADIHTMDEDEVISMLRSRGVQVPEKRLPRTRLAELLKILQKEIRDATEEAGTQTEAEPRKRSSSRKRAAVKAAAGTADDESRSEAATPTRPRRKSGPAAVKEKVDEEPEEEEGNEPEKKKRRSSSRPIVRRRSSVRPGKKTADQEEEQQQEKEQEKEEEKKTVDQKKRRSSVTTRGRKRALDEANEDGKKNEPNEDEKGQEKPRKRGRKSSLAPAPKKAEPKDDDKMQDGPGPEEPQKPVSPVRSPRGSARKSPKRPSVVPVPDGEDQPVPQMVPGQFSPAPAEPVVAVTDNVPAKGSGFSFSWSWFSALFSRNSDKVPESVPERVPESVSESVPETVPVNVVEERPNDTGRPRKSGRRKSKQVVVDEPVPDAIVEEEAVPAGITEPPVGAFEEVVEKDASEKKKGIVVTPKLEIIVLSICVALFAVFVSLAIMKWSEQKPQDDHNCGKGMVWSNETNSCLSKSLINQIGGAFERFLSQANGIAKQISHDTENRVAELKEKFNSATGLNLEETDLKLDGNTVVLQVGGQIKMMEKLNIDPEKLAGYIDTVSKCYPSLNVTDDGSIIFTQNMSMEVMWGFVRIPLFILVVTGVFAVIVFFIVKAVKGYLDQRTSTKALKESICKILKDQAEGSAAQASALAGSGDVSVMSQSLTVDTLKTQVMNDLSVPERTDLVVRFRMWLALRSLRSNKMIRFASTIVDGKSVETVKWVGKIDS